MSLLPHRWRAQRNAKRNVNCTTQWIIKYSNAHGTFLKKGEYACVSGNKNIKRKREKDIYMWKIYDEEILFHVYLIYIVFSFFTLSCWFFKNHYFIDDEWKLSVYFYNHYFKYLFYLYFYCLVDNVFLYSFF